MGGSGYSKHSMQSEKAMKPDWLAPSEGTSHPYLTTAHIEAVQHRFEQSVCDTGYRRRVAIARGTFRTREDYG